MRFFKEIFLFSVLLAVVAQAYAQRSYGGFPLSDELEGAMLRTATAERWEEMPLFDEDSLLSDSSQLKIGGIQFAYAFNTDFTPQNSGQTFRMADGTRVWRLKIRSLNAKSINLIFSHFHLNGEARLFIYSPDRRRILGAYTQANNRKDSILATTPVEGDEVVVEYIEPKGSSGVLRVGNVNHGFRDWRTLPGYGQSAYCEVDASCRDVPSEARRSVALVMVKGTNLCSGALVNNEAADGKPYFLSAAHCLTMAAGSAAPASLASTCVFYFNYESPHCFKTVQGTLEMSLSGATVRAMLASTDLLLMELDEKPPVEYNTYYAGWNAASAVDGAVFTLHHPQGDVKKFTHSSNPPSAGTFSGTEINFGKNGHWIQNGWDEGITEGGSSGAPLFDSENRIIGALSGGYDPSGCGEETRDAFYRLNVAWTGWSADRFLSSWLDPNGTGTLALGGREPYQFPCDRVSNYAEGAERFASEDGEYLAGTNSTGIYEFAERFATQGGTVYGVFFLPEAATFHASDTVWLKIYDGKDFPEKLLYKQRVRISDAYYTQSGTFAQKEINLLSSRDNYLHFDQPVKVDSTFFVAVEVPKSPHYPFGICVAAAVEQGNSALYQKDGVWHSFTEYELKSVPATLLLEPQMMSQKWTGVQDVRQDELRRTIAYPNPTDGTLHLRYVGQPERVTLSDLRGVLVCDYGEGVAEADLCGLPSGIYLLKVMYADVCEVLKVFVR